MTIVVLVILAMVWAVVLGPSLLRRRAERRSSDSIGDFHRQLRILQRTGPTMVDPAHRLEAGPFRAPGVRRGPAVERRADPYFRPEACKHRRDVLGVLLCVLVGSGLLGAIPPLRVLLYITFIGAAALASYVALLVYMRNMAVERESKLRYLPGPVRHEPSVVIRRVASR